MDHTVPQTFWKPLPLLALRQGPAGLTGEYSGLAHNRNFSAFASVRERWDAGVRWPNYLTASNHPHMLCPGAWEVRLARGVSLLHTGFLCIQVSEGAKALPRCRLAYPRAEVWSQLLTPGPLISVDTPFLSSQNHPFSMWDRDFSSRHA